MTLHYSPLHEEHKRLGAKLVDFAGWMMPLQYSGVVSEHLATRNEASLFDVSHLGKLVLPVDALESLDKILPGKVSTLGEWQAGYNLVLNERAGIVDDIFVYRRPDSILLVPNAANVSAVQQRLFSAEDAWERWAILALQGPRSHEISEKLAPDLGRLGLHEFTDLEIGGSRVQAARTGYTGEFGFEFFVEWTQAPGFWNLLIEAGAKPAGLGARDTLRLEMGYPLHGHEISEQTNPIEASLNWVIDWEKPEFEGRDVLQKVRERGPERKLVGLISTGREIPRADYPILHEERRVGEVTSGNFSPVLRKGIALGYVSAALAQPGTMLAVDVRGRRAEVEVRKPPFIKS